VAVLCYTNCEQVELLLNGRSLGEKRLSSANNRVLAWDVPYADGSLQAIGKKGNKSVCSFELMTVGKPQRIRLSPDRTAIATASDTDARDIAHVEVSVVDSEGNTVTSASDTVHFEIAGPGRIIGVDSGDQSNHDSFKAPARAAFQGKCLVIVQSDATPGTITLKATAPGLAGDQIKIASELSRE
jgi:beta-galactosidase